MGKSNNQPRLVQKLFTGKLPIKDQAMRLKISDGKVINTSRLNAKS